MAKNDYSDLGYEPVVPAKNLAKEHADLGYEPVKADSRVPSSSAPADAGAWDAFKKGGVQGATYGFGDELGAGAGLLGAKLGGDTRNASDIYDQFVKEQRAEQADAAENHPIAHFAGELGGGMLTGGAFLTAARSLGLIKNATEAAAAYKAMSAGQKIAAAGKAGAVVGGIAGLGGSEANLHKDVGLSDIGQAAKDTVVGSGMGVATGMGGSALHQGLGAMGQSIKRLTRPAGDIEYFKDMGSAYNLGAGNMNPYGASENIVGTQARQKTENKAAKLIEEVDNLVNNKAPKELGKLKGDLIAEGQKEGVKVDITPHLEKALEDIKSGLPENTEVERNQKQKLINFVMDRLNGQEQEKPVTANYKKFIPAESIPAIPGAREKLESEAAKAVEQGRQLGQTIKTEIVNNTDEQGNKLLTLVKHVDDGTGPKAVAKTIFDKPGVPEITNPARVEEGQLNDTIKTRTGGKPISDLADIDQFKQSAQNFAYDENYKGAGRGNAERIMKNLARGTKESVEAPFEDMPQIREGDFQFRQGMPDTNQGAGARLHNPLREANQRLTAINNAQDYLPSLTNIQQVGSNTQAAGGARNIVKNLTEHLKQASSSLDPSNPIKGELDSVGSKLKNIATRLDLTKKTNSDKQIGGGVFGTLKGGSLAAANTTGRTVNEIQQGISNASPEWLKQAGSMIAQGATKAHQAVGEAIQEMSTKDQKGRSAMIFALSQNPDYRKIMESMGNSIPGVSGETK